VSHDHATAPAPGAILLAVALHASAFWLVPHSARAAIEKVPQSTEVVDIDLPKLEPKPEPPPKEEPMPLSAAKLAPKKAQSEAPPPPAQAAQVLTQKEDPSAPADFTNSIVVGRADTYAGGTSAATGVTKRAVTAFGSGSPTSTATRGTAPEPTGPDLSKRARLAESNSWSCPFPAEADVSQVDHAVVTLRIAVDIAGRATEVAVANDPGNGFGREARACARAKRYETATDRSGNAITGTVLVNVRFDR
jgi:outer membrane biosynthesis protein TonB